MAIQPEFVGQKFVGTVEYLADEYEVEVEFGRSHARVLGKVVFDRVKAASVTVPCVLPVLFLTSEQQDDLQNQFVNEVVDRAEKERAERDPYDVRRGDL